MLIIEPEPGDRSLDRLRSGRPRRDPLLEPEMVTARVRTETLKEFGRRLGPVSKKMEAGLCRAREHLAKLAAAPAPAEGGRKKLLAGLDRALQEIERAERDLHYHAAKAVIGMAELHLPSLIRDAVKRAFPGSLGVGFRLPDLAETSAVAAHAQQLLEALTLAIGMVLTRISCRGELHVTLSRGSLFQEIVVAGFPTGRSGKGKLPRPEDAARLRHLVVGGHQGAVSSTLGDQGEAVITLALPLRRMEAEARP